MISKSKKALEAVKAGMSVPDAAKKYKLTATTVYGAVARDRNKKVTKKPAGKKYTQIPVLSQPMGEMTLSLTGNADQIRKFLGGQP